MSLSTPPNRPVSTLRANAREQDKILRVLDSDQQKEANTKRRKVDRLAMPEDVGVTATIAQPGGTKGTFLVRAHNISQHGIGFIHGGFVHQDSPIVTTLTTPDGEKVSVNGKAKRCEYITNGVHFVGVSFDAPFDAEGFLNDLKSDADDQQRSASAAATIQIVGRVLIVDDSAAARRLAAYMLNRIGATVSEADSIDNAVATLAQESFDMILCDVWIGGDYLPDAIGKLRKPGQTSPPIVAITGDERPQTHAAVTAAGCAQILVKPVAPAALNQCAAALLKPAEPHKANQRQVVSELWSDLPMRPLIIRFVRELQATVEALDLDLGQLSDEAGRTAAYKACMRIGADAAAYGFPSIQSVGQTMCMLIDGGAEAAELQTQLRDLQVRVDAASRGI